MSRHYDYIIAGAGLSGLSLAYRLIHSPLADKEILVTDKALSPQNDKTWSFWHEGKPPFEKLLHKSWDQVTVAFDDQTITQPLEKYAYHSLKSGAFSKAILQELRKHPTVDLKETAVVSMEGDEAKATLQTKDTRYTASYIFQSCLTPPAIKDDTPHYPLIQHFLGTEIQTQSAKFDPQTITLMDFDATFTNGIAFVYILPVTPKKAMLEYTIFSDAVKSKDFYSEKLAIYLHNKFDLRPLDYEILRTEYGEIPMQDHCYAPQYAPRVINMGTVGGLTKPSTGYTFSRIQTHVEAIIDRLIGEGKPALPHRSSFRYRAYDLWLLHIIYHHPRTALRIFEQLFMNNTMDEVFHFLGEKNTLLQHLNTMSKVSYTPFFDAMWKTRKRLFDI